MSKTDKRGRRAISHGRLLELLHYDSEAGIFTHRIPWRGSIAGSRSKGWRSNGYRYLCVDGHEHSEVQLAWFYVHGKWPPKNRYLRLVDGNRDNLAISNLRIGQFDLKKRASRREYSRDLRIRRPEVFRAADLRKSFGIDLIDYQKMFVEQGGCCAACKNPERDMRNGKVKWLAVDHCHETGAVRGLLCAGCNMSIGRMQEDPDRLRAAADYIERHKALMPSNVITIKSRRKRAT